MLSFQPVLLTAGIVTVLYLWLRKLCSPMVSLLLTFTGAFGTMLWPYAYISLETKLSFFASGRVLGVSRWKHTSVASAAPVRAMLRSGGHPQVHRCHFVAGNCLSCLRSIP